ncbi:MAG: hypothetical protein HYU29_03165 [Chloroflexi bacterium]|nr:hypothetical protein [Chloroflexota bacterium]
MGPALEDIEVLLERVRTDRIEGATALARLALRVLRLAARSAMSQAKLISLAQQLMGMRPSMAPIRNIAFLFVQGLEVGTSPFLLCHQLQERLEQAMNMTALTALSIIPLGARVITCSYSSYVVNALAKAAASGRDIQALVLQSMVGPVAYGERLYHELSQRGVMAELVSDGTLPGRGPDADLAVVGMDRLHPDGSLINGTPSLQLARTVKGHLPFYALGDTLRLGVPLPTEEGFDLVPPDLVSAFILEEEVLRPQDVASLPHWRQWGLV